MYDLHPAHYLLYLALLGKDWRRAFTPITNTTRLANGGLHDWGFFRALNRLHGNHWSSELLASITQRISNGKAGAEQAYKTVSTLAPDSRAASH